MVDALRMKSEFSCGERLDRRKVAEEDIENLIIQQIEFCNVILLNKISEVSPEEARRIKTIIRAIQPKARIIECDYADVDIEQLLGTGAFDFESVATSATWVQEIERPVDEDEHHHEHEHHHHDDEHSHHDHDDEHDHGHHHEHGEGCTCGHCHHHHGEGEAEEYGIQTMVYYRRQPFDIHKFDRFVATKWPANVIRTKGVI
ncbi:MAG: GTP-binding protein, partial [Muribaculaceae bacterium]|nr:GTP-binding protein [Muribaculaceae bacterium]